MRSAVLKIGAIVIAIFAIASITIIGIRHFNE